MKLFVLEACPHCQRARDWMQQLCHENPKYCEIPIEIIDEAKEVELANSYDYYLVPTFFDGDKKLHEGIASKEIIQNIFNNYLRRQEK